MPGITNKEDRHTHSINLVELEYLNRLETRITALEKIIAELRSAIIEATPQAVPREV